MKQIRTCTKSKKNIIKKITHKINEKEEEKTTRRKPNTTGIPDYEIDFLARAILPEIKKLFLREDIKEEFKVWKKNRNKEKLSIKNLHNELVPFVFIGNNCDEK